MRTIAEFKSITQAAAANRAYGKFIQIDVYTAAVGEWLTESDEPVFCRYAGCEIVKFGRLYVTALVDGIETQIKPGATGEIQFRIDS